LETGKRSLKEPLLSSSYCACSTFHEKLALESEDNSLNVQRMFLVLCEEILGLMQVVEYVHSAKSDTLRLLSHHVASWCLKLLQSTQRLLDLPSFIATMQQLVRHAHPVVRKHALAMFNVKLQDSHTYADEILFMDMLTDLRRIVCEGTPRSASLMEMPHTETESTSSTTFDTPQQTLNRQSALFSIDLLARQFGKRHKEDFMEVLTDVSSLLEARGTHSFLNNDVTTSCFLCLATLTAVLGPAAFPKLRIFFPLMLDSLEETFKVEQKPDMLESTGRGSSSVLLHTAVLSAIASCCAYLPQFLHPYLARIFGALLHPHILSSRDGNVCMPR
jgi:U3 small nucleolar RNA-associated protein 10